MPHNDRNPRHLTRTIETGGAVAERGDLRPNTLVIGLSIEPEVLKNRISQRVDTMVENGFIDEVKSLATRYGWDDPGLSAPGYKAFRDYVEGKVSLAEAKAQFVLNDVHLAKRQRVWFKRNKYIQWVATPEEAIALTEQFLAKQSVS